MRILNRIRNHNCIFYRQSPVLTMKLFTCGTTSLPLSPKILSLSSHVLLPLHLIHTNTAMLENAPKLSSKERKRDTEKRRREKGRERISRTISSTQTLSCPPVIKVLSLGASKVALRWDDCWGRERTTYSLRCLSL